ncbi:MAG: peptidoglycan DD-metalloendopeptidase family protein [Patescibacteria group bacterium]|nr:peptidoglycan DD-metalloendopeptidase family protein [Patescibacteria group bacterium]
MTRIYFKYNKIILFILLLPMLMFGNTAFSESSTELRQKINDLTSQRTTLEGEVASFNNQIAAIESQIVQTDSQLTELNGKITQANADLLKQKDLLREYLRTMYVDGQVSTVELIAKSKSFSEFLDQSEYMGAMQQNVQNTASQISDLKTMLEQEQLKVIALQEQQKAMQTALVQQKAEKDAYLTQVTTEEQAAKKKLSDMLSRGTITCNGSSPVIKASNPIFKFPLNCGYISQGWGNTAYATVDRAYGGAIHNGVDVAVGANTGIHAIGAGTVYATGSDDGASGWGNWIIIQHRIASTDYYSLYAHMIAPTPLAKGDSVTTDDVVGGVGGSGGWPVHLHFSLYKSDKPAYGSGGPSYPGNTIDPLNYMDITVSTGGTDWDPANAH